jgi:molecular chaperone GrpE
LHVQIKVTNEAEEKINTSYQGLYRQMVDIFRGMGLEAVPTVGTPFDPEMHDGIMKEDTQDEPDGTVLEEFRKGFKFLGKLMRPAMVKVAVNTAKPASEGEEGSSAAGSSSGEEAAAKRAEE